MAPDEWAFPPRLARTAWRKGAGTVMADCVAAWVGGETIWMIDGMFEPEPNDEWEVGTWTALVTPNGEVRWADGVDDNPASILERMYDDGHQAVDLDDDGNDEIVYVTHYSHHSDETYLNVLAIVGDRVENAAGEGLALSHDNSAWADDQNDIRTCNAQHAIVDRRIVVTYEGQCDVTGTVTYRYDGARLIQE
jgi:hypothetical protein